MSDTHEPSSYVIGDADDAGEVARLLRQDNLVTSAQALIGEVLPSTLERDTVENLLDVACGAGGWARAVVETLPGAQVVGFDISEEMIKIARVRAKARRLTNVEFVRWDARDRPWPWPDGHFDFINARLISTFMTPEMWPQLLAECFRITRPGGIMRVADGELAISNSPALERLNHNFMIAMHKQQRTFSTTGRSLGIAPVLKPLLTQAGYTDIQQRGFILDASAGTDAQRDYFEDFKAIHFSLSKQRWMQSQIDAAGMEELFAQAVEDFLHKPDFTMVSFCIMCWGRKREAN